MSHLQRITARPRPAAPGAVHHDENHEIKLPPICAPWALPTERGAQPRNGALPC